MTCVTKTACRSLRVFPEKLVIKYDPTNPEATRKTITLTNICSRPQRFMVLPPITNCFSISYTLQGLMFCGNRAEIIITLKKGLLPRVYYDCIKVKCREGCETTISLEASPQYSSFQHIPKDICFGHVLLGKTGTRKITLSPIAKPFEFFFVVTKPNPDLKIVPMKGKVGTKNVEVEISYRPCAYITVNIPVQLYLPKVMISPYNFTVSAHTQPPPLSGRIPELKTEEETTERSVIEEKEMLKRAKKKRQVIHARPVTSIEVTPELPLWSQHHTNALILSKPIRQKSPYELLGPLGRYLETERQQQKAKDNSFLHEVKHCRNENSLALSHRRNKIREQPDSFLEVEEYMSVYNLSLNPPSWESIEEPIRERRRPTSTKYERGKLIFTEEIPNLSLIRFLSMSKFIEVGRKIIILNRMLRRLRILKSATIEDIEMLEALPYSF